MKRSLFGKRLGNLGAGGGLMWIWGGGVPFFLGFDFRASPVAAVRAFIKRITGKETE